MSVTKKWTLWVCGWYAATVCGLFLPFRQWSLFLMTLPLSVAAVVWFPPVWGRCAVCRRGVFLGAVPEPCPGDVSSIRWYDRNTYSTRCEEHFPVRWKW